VFLTARPDTTCNNALRHRKCGGHNSKAKVKL
jgi:hypothetical protein